MDEKALKVVPDLEAGESESRAVLVRQLGTHEGPLDAGYLNSLVGRAGAVFFGNSTCPFCTEMERTFREVGVPFHYYLLDKMPEGAELRELLKRETGHKTVPVVFVKGKFVGGCSEAKALQEAGELNLLAAPATKGGNGADAQALLGNARTSRVSALDETAPRWVGCLFYHCENVDNRVVRVSADVSMVIVILIAVFWDLRPMHWAMAAVTLDFALRFYAGAWLSPIGQFAWLIVQVADALGIGNGPVWKPGASKQFANFCALVFSAGSTLFYFWTWDKDWNRWVGMAWAVCLAGALALQGIFNFCIACVFFQWGIQLGLVPPTVHMASLNTREQKQREYEWMFVKPRDMAQVSYANRGHGCARQDDGMNNRAGCRYKVKGFDHARFDFDVVRHARSEFFKSGISVLGVAALFKFMSTDSLGKNHFELDPLYYQVIGLLAAAWTGGLFFLWTLRLIKYPIKVWRELLCPYQSNSFSAMLVCALLASYVVSNASNTLARVLFWTAAPLNLVLSVHLLGIWMSRPRHTWMINGAMMFPACANFLAVLVAREVGDITRGLETYTDYVEISYLWNGFAFIMMIALFTIHFYAMMLESNPNPVIRGFSNVWYAAFAIAALALAENEMAFKLLFFAALVTWALILRGYVVGYMWDMHFTMGQWAVGFPMAVLAMASVHYNTLNDNRLSKGAAVTFVVLACFANAVLTLRTVAGVVRGKVFVGRDRFGPLSIMVLTHEAARVLLSKMAKISARFADDGANLAALLALRDTWAEFWAMHEMHGRQEDEWIEPAAQRVFPGATDWMEAQHAQIAAAGAAIAGIITDIESTAANGALDSSRKGELTTAVSAFVRLYTDHMDEEELHLSPILRKWVSIPQQLGIVRNCFEGFPSEDWYRVLPIIINNLPTQGMQVKFLRALTWAVPEHAQLIGLMLALGTDAVTWKRVTDYMYEIVPRGAGIRWSPY